MKSTAPFFTAATAIGTSPWPVMNTTGRRLPRSISASNNSCPLMPEPHVEQQAAGLRRAAVGRKLAES
jgi:hypothetical protein